jgi:hypothetical protein
LVKLEPTATGMICAITGAAEAGVPPPRPVKP